MIKPQPDSQGKWLPDSDKGEVGKQDLLGWVAEMLWRFGTRSMERNMALIGFVQLDTNNNFFDTTSAQWSFSRFRGQAMGIYKLCRCNFKEETHKGHKTPTQAWFFKRFHLLNSRLFGGGVFSWAGQPTIFVKRVEQLKHFLDSQTREAYNTT
jgi:hypothetical protein